MELALLVWALNCLNGIGVLITIALVVSLLVVLVCGVAHIDDEAWAAKPFKQAFVCLVISAIALVVIPKEKTAYIMVGAYVAQKIAQDPKSEQFGNKVITIINQKLDSLIEIK